MDAGRELDAVVAVKVFGVDPDTFTLYALREGGPPDAIRPNQYRGGNAGIRHYSTDITAAWRVVEKVAVGRRQFRVTASASGAIAEISGPEKERSGIRAVAPTAPHAICLAALEAVEALSEVSRR